VGQTVLLRYQAFAYQKFGLQTGHVKEVSAAALPMTSGNEPSYRIRVQLDRQAIEAYGSHHPLRAGMAIDASVQLDRRRLFEWLLDPLYSLQGRS
jgi:membrane fusion protein